MSARFEPFKLSPKSLCSDCANIESDCFEVLKSCSGNDQKLGYSYVTKCSGYEKKEVKK